MAGLRKGRGKVFGRTRARACEEKIRMVPFPSPSLLRPFKSISFSFQKPAMQPKEKIANVWNHYETVNMLSSNTYARLTSLGDEGDTVKWRKYKSFHFIVYFIVFLLSCIFLIFTFLTVTLPPKISCRSICEMKRSQGKSDKAWEDLSNEARDIPVKIIYSSYECVRVFLLKKRKQINKKGNLLVSLSFSEVFIYFGVNQPSQLLPCIRISTLSLYW